MDRTQGGATHGRERSSLPGLNLFPALLLTCFNDVDRSAFSPRSYSPSFISQGRRLDARSFVDRHGGGRD